MELKGKIVFSSGKAGDYDIWKLDLETKELSQLTEGDFWNDAPKWSPDGSRIVFVSNRSGYAELWLMDADGRNQTQLTDSRRVHSAPCWHPDGKSLAVCANYKGNADIFIVDLAGKVTQQITDYSGRDSTPCFSPDGSKIVFTSQRSSNDDIWEYNYQTAALRQLTNHPAQDFSPVYSPDGGHIVFVSGRYILGQESLAAGKRIIQLDIFMVDKDGKNLKRITTNKGTDRYVCWSPDGAYLLYTASKPASGAERLRVMDMANMKSQELAFDRGPLEDEIQVSDQGVGIFALLPGLSRKLYPGDYFGTERFPHWVV